jgi:DNA-directed RNA polymerase specialized sigma24 family protein
MRLDELAKKDKLWREMAFQICKEKDLADDLVQEMYLKLCNNTNLIKEGYVYIIIRNLFYDYTKSNKNIFTNFSSVDIYSLIKAINKISIEAFDKEENDKYSEPLDYNELIKGFTWYERTMFELSTLYGQRELSRQTGIHIQTIHRINKKVKSRINGKKKN